MLPDRFQCSYSLSLPSEVASSVVPCVSKRSNRVCCSRPQARSPKTFISLNVTDSSFELSWEAPGERCGFLLSRATRRDRSPASNVAQGTIESTTALSSSLTSLDSSTTYYTRVCAVVEEPRFHRESQPRSSRRTAQVATPPPCPTSGSIRIVWQSLTMAT